MKRLSLTAKKRECGKGISRRLRAEGEVPVVLYGRVDEPIPLSVNERDLEKVTSTDRGVHVVLDLKVDGQEPVRVFIRDYQADLFTRKFTHVDLQAVSDTDKIDIEIPIKLIGKPVGVKEGGVLEQLRHSIELRAIPDAIPGHIEVDVSHLDMGDNVHADDIQIPEGVEFIHRKNFTIAAVVAPTKIEAPEPVVAEGEAAVEGEAAEGEAAAEGKEGEKPAGEAKPEGKKEESKDKK